MKTLKLITITAALFTIAATAGHASIRQDKKQDKKVVVAYVTSWSDIMPDPHAMTHINYAFGHVNETFDGVTISEEARLKDIAGLKSSNPDLKVLLSIGGWGSGRFSEMAADKAKRRSFAKACMEITDSFGIDGIDIDWEYPTSSAAGISSSENDTENFTSLMRDLRKALGKDRLLTLATVCDARYIDFKGIMPYIDFVNVMAYDMGRAPRHHSTLYRSDISGGTTASEAIEAHIAAGVPPSRLVLGLPFYGRGKKPYPDFLDYGKITIKDGISEKWDEKAGSPYLEDNNGELVLGFENPRSLAGKCRYIIEKGLLGGMYWDYDGDNEAGDMRNTVRRYILDGYTDDIPNQAVGDTGTTDGRRIIVLTERGGRHEGFVKAALEWLETFSEENGFKTDVIGNTEKIDKEFLAGYKVFIQLDYPPYNWTDTAKAAFEQAVFDGSIGWVGFHHATLLGDFDGFPMWEWFSDYMGGIRFKDYIAETADGTVNVENTNHPVMKGVSGSFRIEKEEWYTFDRRPQKGVRVLASVDESTYSIDTDVRMGYHPAVWTNTRMKARNVYFLMGHDASLLDNKDFTTMLGNAIDWAAGPGNRFPRFRVLVHYNDRVEEAHRQFAQDGIRFFKDMTIGDGIVADITDNISDFNDGKLRSYHLVVSLNDNPGHSPEQRSAFRRYMENGGSWLGFHSAAYNDRSTGWPWFVDFLGGGVFHRNNWPPQPAKLDIDDNSHPVTKGLPPSYMSPMNEWYQWKPSPRENRKVKVLVSLSPENYPIGFKDTVTDGDFPVVWTNTDYNMLYMNMGHGARIFTDPTQNYLIYNAVRWLMREHFR